MQLSLILIFAPVLAVEPSKETLQIGAQAAILMDRQSGLVLWAHNPDSRLDIASTTKIMTAMVLLDHGRNRLPEQVTVSQHAFLVAQGGSSQFAAGDVVSLEDLLKAMLIKSSNEAAVAAAEHLAGDEQTFIGWMNDKARQLGLRNTHFTNPHGFTKPQYYGMNHKSTARDLALMTREALARYPEIRELVATKHAEAYTTKSKYGISLDNTNKILGRAVPGIPGSRVDGVKTGYIKLSGQCLVASATVNGWQLIAVFLNDNDRFPNAMKLFHHGFSQYAWKTYASETRSGLEAPVSRGAVRRVALGVNGTLGAPVPKAGMVRDEVRFSGKPLQAPIKKGEVVGRLMLFRDGREMASAPAVAMREVKVAWWVRAGTVLLYALIAVFLLVLVGVAYGTRAKNARRRRRELEAGRRRAD
ncbi:MAG: D-alanyl-D-alanine carboxypeptidase family protein [Armatimonadota bacterium]